MAELLRPNDVARLLDVTSAAVRRWIKDGHLPSIKTPGGQYRIRRADAEALLEPEPTTKEPAAA
jgi:excisionase family DNA binding protein